MASPGDTKVQVQDFAAPQSPTEPQRPHFGDEALRIDTNNRGQRPGSATALSPQLDGGNVLSPSRFSIDSGIKRRPTRSNTIRHYQSPTREKWQEPGAEPGIDTNKEDETHTIHASLHRRCDITIVDFSEERVECHAKDNDNLEEFLSAPKEDWVSCRW
jgi:hypothetical protein